MHFPCAPNAHYPTPSPNEMIATLQHRIILLGLPCCAIAEAKPLFCCISILCTLHLYLHGMTSLPLFVRQVIFDCDIDVVICLCEVQESNVISDPHVNVRAQPISHCTLFTDGGTQELVQ